MKKEQIVVYKRIAVLLLHIVLCVLFVMLVVSTANQIIDGRPLHKTSDANYYVKTAYNLQRYNTHSPFEKIDPEPSGYREPGFSAYLALVIALNSGLQDMDMRTFLSGGPGLEILRRAQLPILILTAFLTMYIVYMITKNFVCGYIALFLTGHSIALLTSVYSLKLEHFVAPFVLFVSIFLYKAVKEKSKKYFALLGAALGLLVLTRASFMYFIVFLWVFLILLGIAGVFERRKLLIKIIILTTIYFALVGSWMVRNYVHFGSFYITGRGGVVLLIRAYYNMMNTKEYLGSFLYWTPDQYVEKTLVERYFGENADLKAGALERLNRDNHQTGYYRLARAVRGELMKVHRAPEESPAVDKQLRSIARRKILAHPFRHILTTSTFAWRGLFVETGYIVRAPFLVTITGTVPVNIAYFASLFFLAVSTVRKKRWELLAVILPSLYLYGMQSFFTHNLPRFNASLIPVLVVALLFVIHLLINRQACESHTRESHSKGR